MRVTVTKVHCDICRQQMTEQEIAIGFNVKIAFNIMTPEGGALATDGGMKLDDVCFKCSAKISESMQGLRSKNEQ